MSRKLATFEVYQNSLNLARQAFKIGSSLREHRSYPLSNQLEKSAISIASNLSEGSAGRSRKIFHRHVEIAIGSAYEFHTQLELAKEFLPEEQVQPALDQLEQLFPRLFALRKYLKELIDN